MAANLQAKISKDDTLYIFDRNTEATSNFLKEAGNNAESKGGAVIVASGPREVAEKSVSTHWCCPALLSCNMMSMFYQ